MLTVKLSQSNTLGLATAFYFGVLAIYAYPRVLSVSKKSFSLAIRAPSRLLRSTASQARDGIIKLSRDLRRWDVSQQQIRARRWPALPAT